ncbi:MAG: hypothetical protein HWE34_12125 [Methylocystaceae bacterium]|nr:hypothetical protein [Methylocystaceae bacterium]
MKYLIFNAVVFLALGYLIMGGDTQKLSAQLDQSVQKAKVQAEQVLTPALEEDVIAPIKKTKIRKPDPVAPAAPVIEEVVQAKTEEPVVAPPLPKAVEVAKPVVNEIPSRDVDPAEKVLAQVEPKVTERPSMEKTLVDAKERSKELRQMVAEMEQMFAEKMTR